MYIYVDQNQKVFSAKGKCSRNEINEFLSINHGNYYELNCEDNDHNGLCKL